MRQCIALLLVTTVGCMHGRPRTHIPELPSCAPDCRITKEVCCDGVGGKDCKLGPPEAPCPPCPAACAANPAPCQPPCAPSVTVEVPKPEVEIRQAPVHIKVPPQKIY